MTPPRGKRAVEGRCRLEGGATKKRPLVFFFVMRALPRAPICCVAPPGLYALLRQLTHRLNLPETRKGPRDGDPGFAVGYVMSPLVGLGCT